MLGFLVGKVGGLADTHVRVYVCVCVAVRCVCVGVCAGWGDAGSRAKGIRNRSVFIVFLV